MMHILQRKNYLRCIISNIEHKYFINSTIHSIPCSAKSSTINYRFFNQQYNNNMVTSYWRNNISTSTPIFISTRSSFSNGRRRRICCNTIKNTGVRSWTNPLYYSNSFILSLQQDQQQRYRSNLIYPNHDIHNDLVMTTATKYNTVHCSKRNNSSNSSDQTNYTDTNNSNNKLVLISIDPNGICTITLNRPKKLNALNIPMFLEIQSILRTIIQQQSNSTTTSFFSSNSTTTSSSSTSKTPIRVILVRGAGRAFCTGLDIPSIIQENYINPKRTLTKLLHRYPIIQSDNINTSTNNTHQNMIHSDDKQDESNKSTDSNNNGLENEGNAATTYESNDNNDDNIKNEMKPDLNDARYAMAQTTNLVQDISYLWRQVHVPVIGCIHGMCYGGGLQMVLGMDIRYCIKDTTKLSIMESKWGLIPDMGASITLRELIRIDIAKELTFTGRVITGEEAYEYGLVTKVVNDPIEEGYKLANILIQQSPDVLYYTKLLFQKTYRTGTSEEYCLQLENQYQNQLILSYNQMIASIRNKLGWNIPYYIRKK